VTFRCMLTVVCIPAAMENPFEPMIVEWKVLLPCFLTDRLTRSVRSPPQNPSPSQATSTVVTPSGPTRRLVPPREATDGTGGSAFIRLLCGPAQEP
jgi:hypothetical protein